MKPKTVKMPIIYIWIYLAILTCVVGYGFYCNLDFNPNNAAGVIVAILGILITVVVCWQIYNAYEMSGYVRKMEALKGEILEGVTKVDKKSEGVKCLAEGLFLYSKFAEIQGIGFDSRYLIFCHIILNLLKADAPHDYAPLKDTIGACKSYLDEFESYKKAGLDVFSECYDILTHLNEQIGKAVSQKGVEFDEIKKDLDYIKKKCDKICEEIIRKDEGKIMMRKKISDPMRWASSLQNKPNEEPNQSELQPNKSAEAQ